MPEIIDDPIGGSGGCGCHHGEFDIEKTIKRGFGVVFVVWLLGVLVSLAVLGALGYVAYHFLAKVW